MTRLRRIFGSISFRLALIYTLIFAVSVAGLFYLVFWTTSGFTERQVDAAIRADVTGFQDSYQRSGMAGLVMAINRRVDPAIRDRGIYLIVNELGTPVTGNLRAWPTDVTPDDIWINFQVQDLTGGTARMAAGTPNTSA